MPENNFRQKSDEPLTLIAPSGGVVAGEPLIIGGLFVTPSTSADEGESFAAEVCSVRRIAKSTSVAFTQLEPVYWDVADEEVNDDTANQCVGHAVVAAAEADTHVLVREIDVPVADVSSLGTRMDAQERIWGHGTGGDTATMSDTNAKVFTTKSTVPANALAIGDECEWEAEILISGATATPQITCKLFLGTAELESQVISTAAANDGVVMRGRGIITGATTMRVYKGLGYTKDATVAYVTPIAPADLTIQALTSDRDITASVTSGAGNAGNTAVFKSLRFRAAALN
ncbi:MAG: DUF2190 family protein [Deltaproteobacteria bacterium]|nr:DUF2190 family protein [Deltaproteobacteria bacterium]